MRECKIKFIVDSEGDSIYISDKDNNYKIPICCSGCIDRLKIAIRKFERGKKNVQ